MIRSIARSLCDSWASCYDIFYVRSKTDGYSELSLPHGTKQKN